MNKVAVIGGLRTPIGKLGGALREVRPPVMASIVIKELVNITKLDTSKIDSVIMGEALYAGMGQNPARQASIFSGIPYSANAFCINETHGSGMKAITVAASKILGEGSHVIMAGGMESMTQAPYLLNGLRFGVKFGNVTTIDSMIYDGLWDYYNNFHMGVTGEIVAQKYGISREEMDLYSVESNKRAALAKDKLKEEIVKIDNLYTKKSDMDSDEAVVPDLNIDTLSGLPPIFREDGKITAGNTARIADGAAVLLLSSEESAEENDLKPAAYITGYQSHGTTPEYSMEAPIDLYRSLTEKLGLTVSDIDLIEYNELFAAAALSFKKELSIPDDKLNVNGGAIASGDPMAAGSARIVISLIKELQRRNGKRGLAITPSGGGIAEGIIVELP
ncbi:MAG: acetyl-CoA C-acyltransferase [Candidatus Thermoplasmatota archaeon]|nr:acetyl-CoA C-acyltransferase [Candidatus Thermoplasmatota archaeon]MCL5963132.1 acetyl-CoA C-acyltransferase [Candidatus Thermoplasmatota archaeon]